MANPTENELYSMSPEELIATLAAGSAGQVHGSATHLSAMAALLKDPAMARSVDGALALQTPEVWADPDVVMAWLEDAVQAVKANATLQARQLNELRVALVVARRCEALERELSSRADGWLYGRRVSARGATTPPWSWLNTSPPDGPPADARAETATLRAWIFGLMAPAVSERMRSWLPSSVSLRARYRAMVMPLPFVNGVFSLGYARPPAAIAKLSAAVNAPTCMTLTIPTPHLADDCEVQVQRDARGWLEATRSDTDTPLGEPSDAALSWEDRVLAPEGTPLLTIALIEREQTQVERLRELLSVLEQPTWSEREDRRSLALRVLKLFDLEANDVLTHLVNERVLQELREDASPKPPLQPPHRDALSLLWQARVALHDVGEVLDDPELDGAQWELDDHLESLGAELAMAFVPRAVFDAVDVDPQLETWWARAALGADSRSPATEAVLKAMAATAAELRGDAAYEWQATPAVELTELAPASDTGTAAAADEVPADSANERSEADSPAQRAAISQVLNLWQTVAAGWQPLPEARFVRLGAAAGGDRVLSPRSWESADGSGFADVENVEERIADDDEITVLLGGEVDDVRQVGIAGVWRQVEVVDGERVARFEGKALVNSPYAYMGFSVLGVRRGELDQVEFWRRLDL